MGNSGASLSDPVPGDASKRRWAFSTGHSVFRDAIVREMEGYLLLRSVIMDEVKTESSHPKLEERRVVLALLIASYIEAIANVYLSFRRDAEQFGKIERSSILEKWSSIPASFVPGYRLDPSSDLFVELKALKECRNGIVHMRPLFEVDGDPIHPGNTHALEAISHESVMRWITLPERLVENIRKFDKTDDAQQLHVRSDVWELRIDWDERTKWLRQRRAEGIRDWWEV